MAPAASSLEKRYDICYNDITGRQYRCNYSSWDSWGRWVALVVIVFVALLIAFSFSCVNARRRRRRGMAPMYGTGWMPATGPKNNNNSHNGGYYNNQPYNGGAPAPPYPGPSNNMPNQQTGTTFNSNDGYYGQNNYGQQGVELQQPQNTYQQQRGSDPVYEAPLGAPPRKGDGIIR